jgi:hypothetical protein
MAGENSVSGLRTFVYLIGFGFVLITILVVAGIKKYNENLFDVTYRVNIQKIHEGLLLMTSTGTDYFYSPMYKETADKLNYDETSGAFLRSNFELKKYCGTSYSECFANKYKDLKKKKYIPEFKGACAQLKNGSSICLIPQIADNNITGLMDMNGKYGPNVYGKDLREFEIKARKSYVKKEARLGDVIESDVSR